MTYFALPEKTVIFSTVAQPNCLYEKFRAVSHFWMLTLFHNNDQCYFLHVIFLCAKCVLNRDGKGDELWSQPNRICDLLLFLTTEKPSSTSCSSRNSKKKVNEFLNAKLLWNFFLNTRVVSMLFKCKKKVPTFCANVGCRSKKLSKKTNFRHLKNQLKYLYFVASRLWYYVSGYLHCGFFKGIYVDIVFLLKKSKNYPKGPLISEWQDIYFLSCFNF